MFTLKDYLELVDYTGRAILPNKRGCIPGYLPKILQRLGIQSDDWLEQSTQFEKLYEQRHSKRVYQRQSQSA